MYFTSAKQIVDSNQLVAYSQMTDTEKRQEISNIARNGAVIDAINKGYKKSLEQSDRQHRAEMARLVDNTRELERNNQLVSDQNSKLGEISSILYDTNVILNTGFGDLSLKAQSLVKLAEINSDKMDKLIEVMKIPDYEKERLFKFAKATDYLRQSIKFPERMDDAIEILEEIYKTDSRDPLVLNKLANCYLHSTKHVNLVRSKELFERAISYTDSKFSGKNLLKYDNYINYAYLKMLLDPSYVISIDELTDIVNNTTNTEEMSKSLYQLIGVSLFRCGNAYSDYHDEIIKLMLANKKYRKLTPTNDMVLNLATSLDEVTKKHDLGEEPTEPLVMALLSAYYSNRQFKDKNILPHIDSCRGDVFNSANIITAARLLHDNLKSSVVEVDEAEEKRIEDEKQLRIRLKEEREKIKKARMDATKRVEDEERKKRELEERRLRSKKRAEEKVRNENPKDIGKAIMWVGIGILFLLIRHWIKG